MENRDAQYIMEHWKELSDGQKKYVMKNLVESLDANPEVANSNQINLAVIADLVEGSSAGVEREFRDNMEKFKEKVTKAFEEKRARGELKPDPDWVPPLKDPRNPPSRYHTWDDIHKRWVLLVK